MLQELMDRATFQKCPGCDIPVERVSGCSHMTCT